MRLLQELMDELRAPEDKGFKATQPGVLRSPLSRGKQTLCLQHKASAGPLPLSLILQ